ncbi:MAG: hypothetical protein PVH68_10145 [Armatimonadota bacterium]|jgi:hypothetical protein
MVFSGAKVVLSPSYPTLILPADGAGPWFGADEAGRVVYVNLGSAEERTARVDVTGLAEGGHREINLSLDMPEAEVRRVLGPPQGEYAERDRTITLWGEWDRGLCVEFAFGKVSNISCIGVPFALPSGLRTGADTASVIQAFGGPGEMTVEPSGQRLHYMPSGTWLASFPWLANFWDIAIVGVAFGWMWSLLRLRTPPSPRRSAILLAGAAAVPALYWVLVVVGISRAGATSTLSAGFWRIFASSLACVALWDWLRGRRWHRTPASHEWARAICEVVTAALVGAVAVTSIPRLWHGFILPWPWLGRELGEYAASCGTLALVAFLVSRTEALGHSSEEDPDAGQSSPGSEAS